MTKELYSDVIEDSNKKLEKAKTPKETDRLLKEETKRVRKSIGWSEPEEVIWQRKNSNETKKETKWNVDLEEGGIFEADTQFQAEVLSYLTQINYRLKRLEEKKNG